MSKKNSAFQILIAEDNPADVTLVREALKEHGLSCEVHVMCDGAQAIAFLEHLDGESNGHNLDLLLVDMHVPKRDGPEILQALRATARHSGTPAIVMTSSESPQDREAAERHAAVHYFRKPLTLSEFMELGGIVRGILVPETNHLNSGSGVDD